MAGLVVDGAAQVRMLGQIACLARPAPNSTMTMARGVGMAAGEPLRRFPAAPDAADLLACGRLT